jgi:hypothetical protein
MIPIEQQIEMIKAEQKIDLESGEFQFTEWQKKPTPYKTEHDAWLSIISFKTFRHDNNLLYAIYEPRYDNETQTIGKHGKVIERGFWFVWEKKEII